MKKLLGLLAAVALFAGCEEENARTVVSLSGDGWKFTRDTTEQATLDAAAPTFNDKGWQAVEVPHDWAISGPFLDTNNGSTGKLPWRGVGWYRKTFTLTPAQAAAVKAGDALWLEFDGVMASPKVYVNGKYAGGWSYGYMSFRVDAAPFVKAGVNTLAVRADTRNHHSRWYPGAGIYRDVRLVSAPAVNIVPGTEFCSTPGVVKQSAHVHIEYAVTNRLAVAAEIETGAAIFFEGNSYPRPVETTKRTTRTLAPHEGATLAFDVELRNPQVWDVTAPNLYSAVLAVKANERTDMKRVRFGVRTFKFTAEDGFHLNGRRVQLQGVDLHSDLGPLGMAFNRSAMRRQLAIMKEMGVNALRTSHNACDPQVLDLCDQMGIVVWNECFDKWDGTSGRARHVNLEDYVEKNLRQFVRRDRNHPSVVVWSIGNEIDAAPRHATGMSAERFRRFRAAIRELDTTRPVGIGCCHGHAVDTGMFAELDLTGWNYRGMYDRVKAKHPNLPVVYSESASALSSYGHFEQPPAPNKTAYDTKAHEVGGYDHNSARWSDIPDQEFARMERDRYVAGEFVWTGIDYLGEPTPYIDSRSSYFGICDLMAVPKDRYWLYRAYWNPKATTLHILPHWNWAGREGQNVPVYVYTNGDEAELFLNGKSLGKRRKGVLQRPANLAKGKVCTASSVQDNNEGHNLVAYALDGDAKTRWCAAGGAKGEWWQVDLGAKTKFGCVSVLPEMPAKNYAWRILVSDDAQTWREYMKKTMDNTATYAVKQDAARYVRIVFDEFGPATWASMYEFAVYADGEVYQLNPYYDVCDRYRLRWFNVPYQPGELKVVAYKDGKELATKVLRTAEKPVAVQLTAETPILPADGQTLAFVQVDVVDAKGTRDPRAKNLMKFKLEGPGRIVAVGNGDADGTKPFTQVDSHALYNGKAVVVVRRNKGATQPVKLTVTSDGLKPASYTFK